MKKIILLILLGITFLGSGKEVLASPNGVIATDFTLETNGDLTIPTSYCSNTYYGWNFRDDPYSLSPTVNVGSSGTCPTPVPIQLDSYTTVPDGNYIFSFETNGTSAGCNAYSESGGSACDYYILINVTGGIYTSSQAPPDNTLTRWISVTPEVATTTATTTTIGAVIYINENDYEEDMYLSMSFTNQTLSLTGGSALDAFNSASGQGLEIHLPLTSGYNNVSTTTTFLYAGRTDGKYSVESDSFISSLPLFGDFFNPNTLIASTTYFYVGFKSGLDNAVDLGASSVSQYLLTGTTTGANTILNCSNLLSGGITPCVISLFVPNAVTFGDDLLRLRNGFLSVWPLGYVTRFVEIFVTTSTSSLPVISYSTASTSMFGAIDINFDPFGSLNDPDNPINYVSDNEEDPQTIWEIMEYPITIVVYLMLLFMIIHDLTGVKKHDTGGDGEPIELSYRERVWFGNNLKGGHITKKGEQMARRGRRLFKNRK